LNGSTSAVQRLTALPRSDRRESLDSLIAAEFSAALMINDGEDLSMDMSYFDMGMTSLRVTEIRRHLERLLACTISSNVLFNQPTVRQLAAYIAGEVLPELFDEPPGDEPPGEIATIGLGADRALLDEFLGELYQA
jgi:acyl carrier protein